ncbi:hypothetical protein L195_g044973, partial [Trifolium pratense]
MHWKRSGREIDICLKQLDACRVDEQPKVEELKVETKVEQGSLNMKEEIKPSPPELKVLPSHL